MAAGTLAELVLKISAQDSASTAVNTMGAKIKAELASIGKIAAGLVLGNIAQSIGGDIAQKLHEGAEAFDVFGRQVATVKRLTGESAENSSLLLNTFTRYGMSADQATTALVKLARSMAGTEDATDIITAGGKSGAAQLNALGISMTDVSGKAQSSTQVILSIADAIKDKSATEQISIISTIFKMRGSEASDLQRVLMQGRGAIEEYFGFLRSTGNTVNGEQLADVGELAEAHRRLDIAVKGTSIQFDASFAPAITSAATVAAHLGVILNQSVLPLIERIPFLLPALTLGLGVLLSAALVGTTAQMVKFVAVGLVQTEQAIVRMMIPMGALIARYAAVASAALAAGAAQVAAWLAAAGPIVLIIGGIVLAAGAIALALSGKLGEAKDAIINGFIAIGEAAKAGWKALEDLNKPFELPAETKPGEGGGPTGPTETKAEKAAKAAKAAADQRVKSVQDAAAQRKDTFELGHIEQNRGALEAKLAEAQANQALLPMKRELEDLDRASLDYAHQRLVINQDELATQARIGEEKLKNAADDLSYQEKLLLAQARAAKMSGENVDMDALRQKVMAIRTAQIEGEPGLLMAGHNTALADRAKNATSLTDQVAKDEIEKRKLAIQEANQPLQDELTLRKRMTEDAQNLLELDKMRFEITETFYAKDLLLAQIAAKAADEAYQKAVAAATAAGVAPGTAPLSAGVAGSGEAAPAAALTANVTVNVDTTSVEAADSLKQAAIDGTLEALLAAQKNQVGGPPARRSLPGAFATATP